MLKAYNNIYIRSEGNLTIEMFINDVSVATKVLSGALATHDITMPQEKQRGYSFQFTITGTGKLHEIEYKAVERKNGR